VYGFPAVLTSFVGRPGAVREVAGLPAAGYPAPAQFAMIEDGPLVIPSGSFTRVR
jgi:hypothetical protein